MESRRERILRTKPWLKSTGPRTALGKLIASSNSVKTGKYSKNALLREAARHQEAIRLGSLELDDLKRRIRPFVLSDRQIPRAFRNAIDCLGLDFESLAQQIRQSG